MNMMVMSDFLSGHSNLSALQIIGSCVSSLLGPTKTVKCLFDEESSEGVLVTSTNELLQGLDIEHPVGQLVREFCLSQCKCHGCGCTTLVTLAGLWAANVQTLLDQDVPMQEIIRAGDEFIQECEDFIDQSAISIRAVSKSETVMGDRSSSVSLESSDRQDPSDLWGTMDRCLNQNSNNSCGSPSHVSFQTTTQERTYHVERKHAGASDLSKCNSSSVTKHSGAVRSMSSAHASTVLSPSSVHANTVLTTSRASAGTVLSTSSAIRDTSSANLKQNDDDDVSWFFENDSQYSRYTSLETNPEGLGSLTRKLDDISLCGYEQADAQGVEQAIAVEDDEWLLNHTSLGGISKSNDHQKANSGLMRGDDISIEMINSKIFQDGRNPRERTSEASCQKLEVELIRTKETVDQQICRDAQSVLTQNQTVRFEGKSVNETSKKRSERLESLLKNAILQKPSNPSKGRPRILSRHLLADELEMSTSPKTSEMPVHGCETKMTSRVLSQGNKTDEKRRDIPLFALRDTSSDHMLRQAVQIRIQNVYEDGPRILADKMMPAQEAILQAELSSEIELLGDRLNPGAVYEMKLAIEACQVQLKSSQDPQRFNFQPDLVHIQPITGPAVSSSCCVDGLVVPVDENQLSTLRMVTGRRMSALLVNGDLEESYKHRGFKDSLKSSGVISGILAPGSSSDWTHSVLSSLKKLNINMLLVRGSVDSSLVDACCFHHILIIQHVHYRLLQLLGTVFKSNLIVYIQDALQDDVCQDMKMTYWSSGYDPHPTVRSRELKIKHHVQILCPANVMTIVLNAPSEPLLTGVEHRLHSCMAMLKSALHDGKVIPGGGSIEQRLVEKLMRETENGTDFHQYQQRLIYENLAQGFRSYTQLLDQNIGQHQQMGDASRDEPGHSCDVYDCFSAKKGAWQRAWHLLRQVLLCDALIITGIGQDDKTLEKIL
ncbi:Bardet-Biedl syndrome 12 protein homolog [Lytechinus variegatus]|uniref:Bardet-Biedl syndrome 12 protein homolog n=1 Tax=Lytechinus variegatus TaxID=7654 RepID=UPI001BB21CBD|nr:Bardet-Biedl syndrome 12 protein homolog [Lytechinus variegatus]